MKENKKKIKKLLIKVKKIIRFKNKFVPLHEPTIQKKDIESVTNCLKSTFISSAGSKVLEFEKKIQKITKSKNIISVVNGTCGLQLGLKILGVGILDEILMPSLTFAGTVNAVLALNAKPHFVDSEYLTMGVDPEKLYKYLKKNTYIKRNICFNKKTKSIIKVLIVVHVFGHSAQIDKLKKICRIFNIKLLEDAAECIGSYYKNRHLGSFGDLGVISFNGNKTITTGGGGVILTDNINLAKKAKHLSGGAKIKHKWEYIHDEAGYNYKLPALNASLGISQLSNLQLIIKKKRQLYINYKKNLNDLNFIKVFQEPKNAKSNYWLQTLLIDKKNKKLKNEIIKVLNKNQIMARPAWKLLHTLKHLKRFPRMKLDVSQDLYSRIINIPSSPNLVKKI
jgi:perosamine synthetase